MTLPVVKVIGYLTPLREGGSLPGIVEADDLGTYVCKFRGAGQGLRVLVAEVIVAGLARILDIPTPDQVVLDLDPQLARYEADEEVQDLLNASAGTNLGIDFLPGSFGYDAATRPAPDLAGRIDLLCRGEAHSESAAAIRATAYGTRVAKDDQGTRFGLIKAPRSTVVQPGPVHGGMTENAEETLQRLLERLVG